MKASAEISCCSIVSDQPWRNPQIIETVKANPLNGGVAQLGEHLPCKQGVKGSIPFISTSRQCRLPKPGALSRKPTVEAEAEERGGGERQNRWTNQSL